MHLTRGVFTEPSRQNFLALALGWTYALGRHTIATYLWRSGATALKHFTRFYVFLGAPFRKHQDKLFGTVIRVALRRMPSGDEPVRVYFDETTCKKSGRKIEGASSYRNGAGTARQEYRTLFGLNFVLGIMRLPLPQWPTEKDAKEASLSVPVGLRLYVKEEDAEELETPYHSRSRLARQILDRVCEAASEAQRRVLSVQDGNYSTQEFLQDLPENGDVVGRFPVNSRLYEAAPTERPAGKPGPMPKKGPEVGSPQTLAQQESRFEPHPLAAEEGAEVGVACGIWHSVLPGVMLRVAVVRRPEVSEQSQKKELEAFFTTLCPEEEKDGTAAEPCQELSGAEILQEYSGRWSVEIVIREAKQFGGLGKDQCRRLRRIKGVNAFRMFMLAATRLYFAKQVQRKQQGAPDLKSQRPWYAQKDVPSGRDVLWNCRAQLLAAGITPTVGFEQAMGEFHHNQPATRSRAA